MATADRDDALGKAMARAYERMPPEQQQQMDAAMNRAIEKMLVRHKEMEQVMTALAVLHRPGAGDREGFCGECGNVMPCQTRKFVDPYTT